MSDTIRHRGYVRVQITIGENTTTSYSDNQLAEGTVKNEKLLPEKGEILEGGPMLRELVKETVDEAQEKAIAGLYEQLDAMQVDKDRAEAKRAAAAELAG